MTARVCETLQARLTEISLGIYFDATEGEWLMTWICLLAKEVHELAILLQLAK